MHRLFEIDPRPIAIDQQHAQDVGRLVAQRVRISGPARPAADPQMLGGQLAELLLRFRMAQSPERSMPCSAA